MFKFICIVVFFRNIDERVVFWCLYAMHIQRYRSTGHHLNMATNFCSLFPSSKSYWVLRSETVRKTWAIKDGLTNALIKSRIASLVLFFTDVKHVVVLLPNQYRQPSEAGSCLPPSWGRHQLDREGPSPRNLRVYNGQGNSTVNGCNETGKV